MAICISKSLSLFPAWPPGCLRCWLAGCLACLLPALLALLSALLAGWLTGYLSALLVGCLAGCLLLLLLQGRISLSYNENALVCFMMHVDMSCTS